MLDGRVALVTGGSGGIGAAIVSSLTAAGARVAASYRGGADRAKSTTAALTVQADVADPAACERLVDEVERELGPVEVLVANAGAGERRTLDEVTLDEFDHAYAVNLRAPWLLAKRTIPGMRERNFGRVLFTSSVAAFTGGIVGPHYAASKAGLHGLTHFLAAREAANGITVNALAPALIEDTLMLPGDPGDLAQRIPVGRLGRPEEVADLALAVLRNAYITNQVLGIDGGMHPRG
jgi:3-oxoacyl-[acyl-carrier protein] reductase